MTKTLATTIVLTGALLSGGCATKKYVRQTTTPIQEKVDQVATTTEKQGTQISEAQKNLERHDTEISAAKERAMSADSRATDAIGRADKANQLGQQNTQAIQKTTQDLGELRQTVANLDDYKPVADVTVPFGFNKDVLTRDAKEQLDKLVADKGTMKRYFIAVEGFTDQTGPNDYNNMLSRRRADQVVRYLVGKHDVPIYRIHTIGLGKQKPADEGHSRAARAKNRRVQVTIYSADPNVTAMNQGQGTAAPQPQGNR